MKYILAARLLKEGKLITPEESFSPLYLAINVALNPSPEVMLHIHTLSGVLNSILIYLIVQKLAGKIPALIACIIYNWSLTIYINEVSLEPECFIITALLASILLAIKNNPLSGFFLGIAAALRPVNFLYAARLFFIRKKILYVVFLLIPFILVCIFTGKIHHMDSGQVLFQANSLGSKGYLHNYPYKLKEMEIFSDQPDFAHKLMNDWVMTKNPNKFYIERVINTIKDFPSEFLKLIAKKLIYLFSATPLYDLPSQYFQAQKLKKFMLGNSIIVGFGVAGLMLLKNKTLKIMILISLIHPLIFSVTERSRLLLIVLLTIPASTGIYNSIKSIGFLIFVIPVFILSIIKIPATYEEDYISRKEYIYYKIDGEKIHIVNSILASPRYAFLYKPDTQIINQVIEFANTYNYKMKEIAFISGDFDFIKGKKNKIELKEVLIHLSPLLEYKETLFKFIRNEKINELNQLSMAINEPVKLERYFDPVSSKLILNDIEELKQKIK